MRRRAVGGWRIAWKNDGSARWSRWSFKPNRTYLEAHERRIIIRDIALSGGRASAMTLWRDFPGRYDLRHLHGTLKRLRSEGHLRSRGFWGITRNKVYELTEVERSSSGEGQQQSQSV